MSLGMNRKGIFSVAASFTLSVPWDSPPEGGPSPPELFWEVSHPQIVQPRAWLLSLGIPIPAGRSGSRRELRLIRCGGEAPKRGLEVAAPLLRTCVEEKLLSQLCYRRDKPINKLINEVLPPEQRGGRDFDPSPRPGLSQMSPGSVAGAFRSQKVLETAGFLLKKGAVAPQGWCSTWRLPPITLGMLREPVMEFDREIGLCTGA